MDTDSSVIRELGELFARSGYVRRQNPSRVSEEGSSRYKKGDEIRLVIKSEDELVRVRSLLEAAGFKPGKPYSQGSRFRQPLYGRRQVEAFLAAIEA
jgi:hypothetical protein